MSTIIRPPTIDESASWVVPSRESSEQFASTDPDGTTQLSALKAGAIFDTFEFKVPVPRASTLFTGETGPATLIPILSEARRDEYAGAENGGQRHLVIWACMWDYDVFLGKLTKEDQAATKEMVRNHPTNRRAINTGSGASEETTGQVPSAEGRGKLREFLRKVQGSKSRRS